MESSSATATSSAGPAGLGRQAWLTTILRPAGSLDQAAMRRLGAALGRLAADIDMVVVDLTAADVRDPRGFARVLRDPAAEFERDGVCLLVVGVSPMLTAELNRATIPVVALGDDAIPAVAA